MALPVDERLVPEPDDTALFHELRRRLAADVLAGAERGDMAIALDTLRYLAQNGASEKVRGKAAADLARVLASTASARQATVNVGTVAVVTAADLLAGVDPAALRAATATALAARSSGEAIVEARVIEAGQASQQAGGRGTPGSDQAAGQPHRGSPIASVTGESLPRVADDPCPW